VDSAIQTYNKGYISLRFLRRLISSRKMKEYTPDQHDVAVRKLAEEVTKFTVAQIPFRTNHGSTNSTRRRDLSTPQLRIAHLSHILEVDINSRTAIVELNVSLDSLFSETLRKGLMPLVVMEFPGITVCGGFSGASGESTGWRKRLFDCGVEQVEMILGSGDVVLAN
jgi:delta24-sterol reductase